jgi:hypothetical protein
MDYLGAWGTLIHEKNLKSKISCQTPFKASHLSCLAAIVNHLVNRLCILSVVSSLGRYVFGSEISYNKAPPRLPGLGC